MNPWLASVPDWITAGASLLALIGVFAVRHQIVLQKEQLIRDIENDYVRRYWQIRDGIDASRPGSAKRKRWHFAYLRLCEDEIDLHEMDDRITAATWEQWDSGMRAELASHPIYKKLLAKAPKNTLTGVRALMRSIES